MVLYEKFGDDYEQVVAALPTEERRRLKREVGAQEAKTVVELLGRELVEAEGELQRVRQVNGNSIGFFWPEKTLKTFEKVTCMHMLPFSDISGRFLGCFYYCSSVPNSKSCPKSGRINSPSL